MRADDPPASEADSPPRSERLRLRDELADETLVRLEIAYPPEDAVIRDSACGVFVAGRALALRGELHRFDVAIVLDTSRSTVEPANADIDEDGIVGEASLDPVGGDYDVGCTDPGDSILAAEVAGARALLRGFDPRSTRVALVRFAGDAPEERRWLFPRASAVTLEPLTADYDRIERALAEVASSEPDGHTDMAAGVDVARAELLGADGAASVPDSRSEKIIFFFTDGRPTLPHGPEHEADNVRAVLAAANRARDAQIRIHSFAIGREALEGPVASVELAGRTAGSFTPVRHPGDLVEVVGEVSFANVEAVGVRSLTTGEPAELFRETADGSWAGFVRTRPGRNEIEIRARASDGSQGLRKLAITSAEQGDSPAVPADLVVAHNRLLDECLRRVKDLRMQAERRRAEQVRQQLLEEIARERARASERAAEQRKQLDLEMDEKPAPPGPR